MPKIANKGKPFKYERICKLDECNIIIKNKSKNGNFFAARNISRNIGVEFDPANFNL